MNNTRELNTMCCALQELKEKENEARDARLYMEERIIAMLPKRKPEGVDRYDFDDLELKVTSKVYRKVDYDKYNEIELDLTPEAREAVVIKYDLSLPAYRKLSGDAAGILNQCITTTDAKPALSIKEINK